jgi:hypothetical protein
MLEDLLEHLRILGAPKYLRRHGWWKRDRQAGSGERLEMLQSPSQATLRSEEPS